jgi:hypothetical protein
MNEATIHSSPNTTKKVIFSPFSIQSLLTGMKVKHTIVLFVKFYCFVFLEESKLILYTQLTITYAAVAQWQSASLNSLGLSVVRRIEESGEFGKIPQCGTIPSQARKGFGFLEGVETSK